MTSVASSLPSPSPQVSDQERDQMYSLFKMAAERAEKVRQEEHKRLLSVPIQESAARGEQVSHHDRIIRNNLRSHLIVVLLETSRERTRS